MCTGHPGTAWSPTAEQTGNHPIVVQVDDGRGGVATQTFHIEVTTLRSNQPPQIVSSPSLAASIDRFSTYDAKAIDAEGDPVLWSLDVAPHGMAIDPFEGLIRWIPNVGQRGSREVVVRATDPQGAATTQSFVVDVQGINRPPMVLSTPSTYTAVGQPYYYAVAATDPDADPISFSLVDAPDEMSIDPGSGVIRWMPQASQLGTQQVTVRVEEGRGGWAVQSYAIDVDSEANRAPVITSSAPYPTSVGSSYQYAVTSLDPDGDSIRFSLTAGPDSMTIDADTGLLQWMPAAEHLGIHAVTVTASDSRGAMSSQSFRLPVLPPNTHRFLHQRLRPPCLPVACTVTTSAVAIRTETRCRSRC